MAFLLIVLLRVTTLARDTWEWDEVLFVNAAEGGIDVRENRPHPPGYPAFVLPGRLLAAALGNGFAAVTGVALLGGLLAVIGVYSLGRAVSLSASAAAFAAVLYAVIPAVWIHSVRPLSDGCGAAAFLFAAERLVVTARNARGRDLVVGALVSALCAGIRPQSGLALLPLAAFAAFRVFRSQGPRVPALALATGLAATGLLWAPAISGSGGLAEWRRATSAEVGWMSRVEAPKAAELRSTSFRKRWLFDPLGGQDVGLPFWGAAVAALCVVRKRGAGALTLLFLPLVALSVFVLNAQTAPRYAVAFLAWPCLLIAIGIDALKGRWLRPALGGALLAWVSGHAVRPIVAVSAQESPPIAAFRFAALRPEPVYFEEELTVHAQRFLPEARPLEGTRPEAGTLLVVDPKRRPADCEEIARFAYPEANLARTTRGRYLATCVCLNPDSSSD